MIDPGTYAIILAGGLGTRLRSVVSDLPKCMAPINGKPFLSHLIKYLLNQGISDFVFSVGYKSEIIIEFIQKQFPALSYQFSIEDEPLGTGGAVKLACKKTSLKTSIVCNGDTLFKVELSDLIQLHNSKEADCTLSLKHKEKFDRYGVVELNPDDSISNFKEKQWYEKGLINGGVYALHTGKFLSENLPLKFSFEKEYLENYFTKRKMYGLVQDEYFIDIGIPEDYHQAQSELTD